MARTLTVTAQLSLSLIWTKLSAALLTWALVGLWVSWAPASADAAVLCRTVSLADQPHEVCILKITRSAKQYWEYRAAARVDGKARPVESYDCQQRIRLSQDGKRRPIDQDAAGTLICQLFDR